MEDETILPKSHPQSPFHTGIPLASQPTETVSKRFELWRQILKSLIQYFKCVIISNKEFSKINSNITNQISFPFFTDIRPKGPKGILKHSNASNSTLSVAAANAAKETLKPTTLKEKIHKHARSLSKSQINLNLPQAASSASSIASTQVDSDAEEALDHFNMPDDNIHGNEDSGMFAIVEPSIENRKKQSFFNRFGDGSIQDLQVLLKKYHLNLSKQQLTISKQLEFNVLPLLEDLQRDLLEKCKEIKLLSSDFKNSMNNEIAITGQILNDYISAVKGLLEGKSPALGGKDPFLLKLRLELQIKQQLNQENYLEEAFVNLQTTGMELEKIIYETISDSLNKYGELISQEIFVYYNDLINELHQGLVSKPSYYEWDKFIDKTKGKLLLDLKHGEALPKCRKLSDLRYPFNKSVISKTIRSGWFHKKSKIFKNYSRSFFLLTLTHLHEFRSSNLVENFEPVNSYNLNDCLLVEVNDHKFQLNVLPNQKEALTSIVFKKVDDMDPVEFKKWVVDLRKFTSFNTFNERYQYYCAKWIAANNTPDGLRPAISRPNSGEGGIISRMGKMNVSSPNLSKPESSSQILSASNKAEPAMKPRLQILSLPKFEIQEPSPLQPVAKANILSHGPSPISRSGSPQSMISNNNVSIDRATTPTRGIGQPFSAPTSPALLPRHISARTHNHLDISPTNSRTGTPISPAGLITTPMFEEDEDQSDMGYFDIDHFQLGQSLYTNGIEAAASTESKEDEGGDNGVKEEEQVRLERVLSDLNKRGGSIARGPKDMT